MQRYRTNLAPLLTIVIFVFLYWFVPLQYEENDDVVMMMLANGKYSGSPSSLLVYISPILSNFLSTLYSAIPHTEWYVTTQIAALSLSAGLLISRKFESDSKNNAPENMALTITLLFFACCVFRLQFTTTAAISVAVGALAFLLSEIRLTSILGLALLIYGFLLRFEAAILCAMIIAPLLIAEFQTRYIGKKRIAILAGSVATLCFLDFFNGSMIADSSKAYWEYESIRRTIVDNPWTLRVVPLLSAAGISRNDVSLFYDSFPDPGFFSRERMLLMSSSIKEIQGNISFSNWLKSTLVLASHPLVVGSIAWLLVSSISLRSSWQKIFVGLSLLTYVACLIYVETFATLKFRVLISASLPLAIGVYYLGILEPIFSRKPHNLGYALRVFPTLFLITVLAGIVYDRISSIYYRNDIYQDQAKLIGDWDGHVIFYKTDLRMENSILLTDDLDPLAGKLVYPGWLTNHPDSPFFSSYLDFLDQKVVLFLHTKRNYQDTIDSIKQSLLENYNVSAKASIVGQSEYGVLVAFSSEPRTKPDGHREP